MRHCVGSSLSSPARPSLRTWASLRIWARLACIWTLSPAREPEMCVGGSAQVHVEGLTCVSTGLRAGQPVTMRSIGEHAQNNVLTREHMHRARHLCAQNVDHLAHNAPFSTSIAEVVCSLGATPA